MGKSIKAGDVDIKSFTLKHPGGTIKLVGMANRIEIFESIKMPYIQGYIVIFDDRGMLDQVMLTDSDVEIEFTTHDKGDPTKFKFKVNSVKNAVASDSGKYKTYTLDIVSEELLKGTGKIITQIFNKKDVNDIVEKLYDNLGTEKKLTVEKTLTPDTISITKLNVFQAIDKARQRAVSRNNKSSSYCFFENRNGYFFTTIENIINEAKKDPALKDGELNFFYDTDKKTIDSTDWRNIISLQQLQTQNIVEMLSNGGIRNAVWSFNVNTGEWKKTEFKNKDDDDEYNIDSESYSVSKASAAKYANTAAFNALLPIFDEKEIDRLEKQSFVTGYVLKLLGNMMNIYIHGDSVLTAGTVINIEFPIMSGGTKLKKNELISGNYLITKIRHIIEPTSDYSYFQSCEILRTGFYKD